MARIRKSTLLIQKTEAIIGQLYPVLVDADTGEILDGRERTKVNPDWRKEKFSVPGGNEEEKELNRLRIKHISNWARKETNKTSDLSEIAERTGWRGLKPFAEFLGVDESTISRHLPQKYKDKIKSDSGKNKPACNLQAENIEKTSKKLDDIKKEIELTPLADEKKEEIQSSIKTTQNLLSIAIDASLTTPISIEEKITKWLDEIEWEYSLWECQKNRPEGYGSKNFHGNCSPTIIAALLKRFSSLDDELIFDPMVGSGTFIDVAKALGYSTDQILGRDIQPRRDDIEYGDAINTQLSDDSVDFVFAHFPYWKLIEYTIDNPQDASRYDFNGFLEWTENVFVEMNRILKHKKYFAVMIGNLRKNGVVDLESLFSNIGTKHFILWDKIIKRIRTWDPETRGQRMGLALSRARQHGYTVVNHDTILIFRKG